MKTNMICRGWEEIMCQSKNIGHFVGGCIMGCVSSLVLITGVWEVVKMGGRLVNTCTS